MNYRKSNNRNRHSSSGYSGRIYACISNRSSYYTRSRSSYNRSGRSKSISTKTRNGYSQYYDKGSGLWKFTYRRVAEKKLGGRILSGYEVHYIDLNKLIENARAFIMVTMIGWEDSKAPAICLKQRDNRPSDLTVIPRSVHRSIHSNGGFWSRFKRRIR